MDELFADGHNERYNRIRHIDDQKKAAEQTDFQDILRSVGQILLRHHAHIDFGISLVHRHTDLAPNHAMVHSYDTIGKDICHMEEYEAGQLFPQAYYLDCDQFLPYEYSYHPAPIPEEQLLNELATFLRTSGHCHLIGIFHVRDSGSGWIEKLSSDGNGTVATRLPEGDTLSPEAIITEWTVRAMDSSVALESYRACEDTVAGHKRT